VPESRNIGFSKAKGEIFVSIDSDMVLEPTLLQDIMERMDGFGALVIPELGCGSGFLSRCKSLEKQCYIGDEAIESARAFTREAFEAVAGYDPNLHMAEDHDLHWRVSQRFPVGRTRSKLYHDTCHLSLLTDLKKSFRYGRSLPRYLAKKDSGGGTWMHARKNLIKECASRFTQDPQAALGLMVLRALEHLAGAFGFVVGQFDSHQGSVK
jgi:arabinofuranan 3-O-arabinosyltransferase